MMSTPVLEHGHSVYVDKFSHYRRNTANTVILPILWPGFEGSLPVLVYMLVYVIFMLVYATLTRVLICHCANNNVLQEEELSAPV